MRQSILFLMLKVPRETGHPAAVGVPFLQENDLQVLHFPRSGRNSIMDNVAAAPIIFPIGQRYRHHDWPLKSTPITAAPRRMLKRSKAVPSGQFFMFVTDSAHMIKAKKARAKETRYFVRKTEGSRLKLNPSVCKMRPTPGKGQIPHQNFPRHPSN